MKPRHLTHRSPRKKGRYSWCRVPDDNRTMLQYRLFVRDSEGISHGALRMFSPDELIQGERYVAGTLREMRAHLRWSVDKVEFARLGLVDDTPAPEAIA